MKQLSESTLRLATQAGYGKLTEIQERCVQPILNGSDVLARAPTGTGKTAAFLIPLIDRLLAKEISSVIVVEPSRELVIQAANECRKIVDGTELRVVAAYGGTPPARQEELIKQGAQIVVGTPGRLRELMQKGALKPAGVLVLDEADRLFNKQFAADATHIASRMSGQKLLFCVSMPAETMPQAIALLKKGFVSIKAGKEGGSVKHFFLVAANKPHALAKQLLKNAGKSIVFCSTSERAQRLSKELRFHGVNAITLHSERDSTQRNSAVKRFKGEENVLVATDLAARGLHFEKVERVYSFEPPLSAQAYMHRAGRTGRMGENGECVTLCTAAEVKKLSHLTGVTLQELRE